MNERDYVIAETLSFAYGVFTSFFISLYSIVFNLVIIRNVIVIPMIFGLVMALYFYFKRKRYICEMKKELEIHKYDMENDSVS